MKYFVLKIMISGKDGIIDRYTLRYLARGGGYNLSIYVAISGKGGIIYWQGWYSLSIFLAISGKMV